VDRLGKKLINLVRRFVRKIIHVDMDDFYASVEQRDKPQLRGKPVIAVWQSKRSVVCGFGEIRARARFCISTLPRMRLLARVVESPLWHIQSRADRGRSATAGRLRAVVRITY
jgi:hypothetical protein